MPRPRDIDRYPKEFRELLRKAYLDGKVSIEFPSHRAAANFRARLYRYRQDVRNSLHTTDDGPLRHRLSLTLDSIRNLQFVVEAYKDGHAVLSIRNPDHDPETELLRSVIND